MWRPSCRAFQNRSSRKVWIVKSHWVYWCARRLLRGWQQSLVC
jgi:hypothetical protein